MKVILRVRSDKATTTMHNIGEMVRGTLKMKFVHSIFRFKVRNVFIVHLPSLTYNKNDSHSRSKY